MTLSVSQCNLGINGFMRLAGLKDCVIGGLCGQSLKGRRQGHDPNQQLNSDDAWRKNIESNYPIFSLAGSESACRIGAFR